MRLSILALTVVLAGCSAEQSPPPPAISPLAARHITNAGRALQAQSYLDARAFADSALTVQPGWDDARLLVGRIYLEQGLLDEADSAFARVRSDHPGVALYRGNVAFSRKQFREALDWYRRAAQANSEARSWHAMGGAYERLGIADSAESALRQAISLDVDYAPAADQLAGLLQAQGRFEEALQFSRRAVDWRPHSFSYRYRYATLLLSESRAAEALPILVDLGTERPWNYAVQTGMGRALQRLGREEEATGLLQHADSLRAAMVSVERLEMNAQEQRASFSNQLAYAEALRAQGRLEESIQMYQRARALRPDDLPLQNNLATLMLQTGDVDGAIRLYESVLSKDPTYLESWLNLALIHVRRGDRERAERYWRQAQSLDADHPVVKRLAEAFR